MINASHFVVSSFSVNFFLPSLAALGWPPFLLRIQSGFAWDLSFFLFFFTAVVAVVVPSIMEIRP